MDLNEYLSNKQELQDAILKYIDQEKNEEENYQNIVQLIKDQNIKNDVNQIRSLLHLIDSIYNNHNRSTKFYEKIEGILLLIKEDFINLLTIYELFNIFNENKMILLFLIENVMTKFKSHFISYLLNFYTNSFPQYFANILYNHIDEDTFSKIVKKCQGYDHNSEEFKQKQKIGENEREVCQLIRNDSIDEFISLINKSEKLLTARINLSIFETNLFLEDKSVTLIQYASFFGSIQIFKYLYKNGVELDSSLWLFAIHGRNPEIISILEENKIKPEDETYHECVIEAIKCHHNEIVDYLFKNNYIQEESKSFIIEALKYHNFQFIEKTKILDSSLFIYYCRYDHFFLVDYFLKNKNYNINTISRINFSGLIYATTPLNESTKFDNTTISELILKMPNVDVNIKSFLFDLEYSSRPLLSAYDNHNLKIFKLLLENKQIDVNATYYIKKNHENIEEIDEKPLLFNAILDDNKKIINLLLAHPNIDVNLKNVIFNNNSVTIKMTPLHLAIENNHIEIIKMLLSHPKIDVNSTSYTCYNNIAYICPLVYAISNNNKDAVLLILSHSNIEANISFEFVEKNYFCILNPLIYAIYLHEKDIVEILLNSWKFNINQKYICITNNGIEREISALSTAISVKDFDIVKILISQPNININDLLMEKKKRKRKIKHVPLLYKALKKGNENIINIFLENPNIDVNNFKITSSFDESETSKYTILHMLVSKFSCGIIEKFLSRKDININIDSLITTIENKSIIKKETSTLRIAVVRDDIDVLKLLLSNPNIDLNKNSIFESNTDNEIQKGEESIIEAAILIGNTQVIEMLLSHNNFDINMTSKRIVISQDFFFIEEKSILQLVILSENVDLIKFICKFLSDKISLSNDKLNELMNMTSHYEIKSIIYNNFNK